jgi:hypothetical protein
MGEGAVVRPDQVSLGVLVSSVPRDVIDAAVLACEVGAKRSGGKLPPHVVAYLTLGLWVFAADPYEEVATKVTGALDRFGCWDADWTVPTSSGITQARKRLGAKAMRLVFEQIAEPVATPTTRGAWLRGFRLLAIDGFDTDAPDSKQNAEEFGYASGGQGHSGYPKVRVVALSECGTHAFLAAEIGAYSVGEKTLARRLYGQLHDDELLTADRNFYSFTDWGLAIRTGAQLLWRAPTGLGLPVVKILPDGTYWSVLINPEIRSRARREQLLAAATAGEDLDPDQAHLVRVIEYDVPDRDGNGTGELIVLLTTILDPHAARPDDLAAGYHERWEQETGHDQLKTHLRGPGKILRSELPDLVHQELWAWLIVQYAMAALITRAAEAADIDPDRLSYTRALRIVRRTATGTAGFSP